MTTRLSKTEKLFLNPPWGQWASWCEKVIQEIERGHIEQIEKGANTTNDNEIK